jgi:hypothetical protein
MTPALPGSVYPGQTYIAPLCIAAFLGPPDGEAVPPSPMSSHAAAGFFAGGLAMAVVVAAVCWLGRGWYGRWLQRRGYRSRLRDETAQASAPLAI